MGCGELCAVAGEEVRERDTRDQISGTKRVASGETGGKRRRAEEFKRRRATFCHGVSTGPQRTQGRPIRDLRANNKNGNANGLLLRKLREFGVFGNVGGTPEVEMVAVGVGESGVPHGVADEGFGGFEAPRFEFMVKRNGIFALKPE